MTDYLLGIDCGTQSAKVAVFDERGAEIASGQQALRPTDRPAPGVVVHPDDDLWDAICAATNVALASLPADATIAAVGLCPIRCCKAFLDADGNLTEPVISWMDDRAYSAYVPDDPTIAYATTASGYVGHRMTGEFVDTAANNIALQWPIDTNTWRWSDDPNQFAHHKVRREQLFELQQPGDIIGTITAAAAAATGIAEGTPVVSTANDKAVEVLGAGSLGESTVLISLGTYIAAMMQGRQNSPATDNFWTNFASQPGVYLYESNGIRRGIWTLTWLLDLLGPEFADAADAAGLSRETYLEREAVAVAPGSDGLVMVLDFLAPTDKPFRKATMFGFDARHTRGHLYRAVLEAIAMTMKLHVDAMTTQLGVSLDNIVLSGGGSNSELFAQIFADVFDLPTSRANGPSGASLGAAMCAASAVGIHSSIDAASAAMASGRQTFTPDPMTVPRYREIITTVLPGIREHTDPLYARSFPLFHS